MLLDFLRAGASTDCKRLKVQNFQTLSFRPFYLRIYHYLKRDAANFQRYRGKPPVCSTYERFVPTSSHRGKAVYHLSHTADVGKILWSKLSLHIVGSVTENQQIC